ncbi:hypothetical protein [Actinoallomurus iriomotensis]|nr:hypothetical protein [Actinoallomurus iriomotensis]
MSRVVADQRVETLLDHVGGPVAGVRRERRGGGGEAAQQCQTAERDDGGDTAPVALDHVKDHRGAASMGRSPLGRVDQDAFRLVPAKPA